MHSVGFSLAIVLVLCGMASSTPTWYRRSNEAQEKQSLPSDLQEYIVNEHNRLRGQVNPPATNMKTMVSGFIRMLWC